MIGEMAILFSMYGERTYLFSLICDLDPPFSLGKKCRFLKILAQFLILVNQRIALYTFSFILWAKKVFF